MCGVAGILDPLQSLEDRRGVLERMTSTLQHRGPDAHGLWEDPAGLVGFGHRRLAIIDLSPQGAQPMHSACGRYTITYNGEIYNYRELRRELAADGCRFRGTSDTEVLLAAIARWGLRAAVERTEGMFAFGLWDAREATLALVRDRIGIKPLYVGRGGSLVAFASELKALAQVPGLCREIALDSVALYLRYQYIPGPYSVYRDVAKVMPGTIQWYRWRAGEVVCSEEVYYCLRDRMLAGRARERRGGDAELVEELAALIREVVRDRLVADVPLGAFLSGGTDSTCVVSAMQAVSNQTVKTFTMGFREEAFDEAPYARAVAQHLGTDHTELILAPEDILSSISELAWIFDEPFSDSSQVPTLFVSRLARNSVTVALSGDGGDELFFGYSRYAQGLALWDLIGRVPRRLRRGIQAASPRVPDAAWRAVAWLLQAAPQRYALSGVRGQNLRNLARIFAVPDERALYQHMVSHVKAPAELLLREVREPRTVFTDPVGLPAGLTFDEIMMFLDQQSYLPDDLLVKLDRTSMAVALEARVPLLDHRVVEFAWTLPRRAKYRGGVTKWILKEVLRRDLPDSLVDRPKKGFEVPLGAWLRGPLREWAGDLLAEDRLARGEVFVPARISAMWNEHLRGERDWHFYLWDILMLQCWQDSRAAQPAPVRS